ncbi:ABC transporter ATP-binding protein [Natrinema sp. 74]|uniref:ABC transporter ATP-binding protein n=1 Tax=Natrinema sp. 74 TaxID=3384159 RepID=UPI0038D3A839
MAEIRLENLRKEFDTRSGTEVAVEGTDLTIDHGELFTFVGPSGCGKTTTLRMIAGLETPTEGTITFDGEDVTDLPPQHRDIAMVFQNVALYPHKTNYDNIGFPLKMRGGTDNYDEIIRETAELLEITDTLEKKPGQLSGGQQQRVALARAIVRNPNAILMDEPMSDLDAKLKADLRVELQRVHDEIDTTIIYVTHDQEEAMTMSTRIGLMNDGRMAAVDTSENIYQRPKNAFVAQFIGQPATNVVDAQLSEDDCLIAMGGETGLDLSEHAATLREATDPDGILELGFRPQHLELTDDPGASLFTLEVDVWEPISENYIVYLFDDEGNEIKTISDKVSLLESGNQIGVKDVKTMFFFDPETGEKALQLDSADAPSLVGPSSAN